MSNGTAGLRMEPFDFRIFGTFLRVEDRSREEFNQGRFFIFGFMGGDFQIPITDVETWNSPPAEGEGLWVVGQIFTNRYGELSLRVKDFVQPSAEHPEPDPFDQLSGGHFSGITSIEKSVFTRQTGEQGYKFVLRGLGVLYSYTFDDRELYDRYPDRELMVLRGRLRVETIFNARFKQNRSYYTLEPGQFVTLRELIKRKQAQSEQAPTDNSRVSTPGRQAPNHKEK